MNSVQKTRLFTLTFFFFVALFFLLAGTSVGAEAGYALNNDELSLINMVNRARSDAGLPVLKTDDVLSNVARTKAQDMADSGTVSQYSSRYGTTLDMIKAAGISYRYAGVSLAKAASVSAAYNALYNSSSNRANMLSSNYDRIGVGVVTKGSYKYIALFFTGGQQAVSAPAAAPAPAPAVGQTSSQTGALPSSQPAVSLNADEKAMLDLVNSERVKAGLAPLIADAQLVRLARLKAADMIQNNYFSHNSPTYGSPFDMMKAAGVSYRYAGENLAGAPTVEMAHNSLMNSPGHRANILNANFTKIGIGVVSGGPYGKMFVQMFTG